TQVCLNIPSIWEYRNNVNQTFYVEFSLADLASMFYSPSLAGGYGTLGNPSPATSGSSTIPQNYIDVAVYTGATPEVTYARGLIGTGNAATVDSQYVVI